MGGRATFTGADYQANVIAYIASHILAQRKLGWFPPEEDVPIALKCETGGEGDDVGVELKGKPYFEVQAKRGLKRAKLIEWLPNIESGGNQIKVVLAVDRSTSDSIQINFTRDLDQLRSKRDDGIHDLTVRARGALVDPSCLDRLFVRPLYLESPGDAEYSFALDLLGGVLEDRQQVNAAWSLLVDEALGICGGKLRRSREEFVGLLRGANILLRAVTSDEKWHRRIDISKQQLRDGYPSQALTTLASIEKDIGNSRVESQVSYRIAQQKSTVHLQLADPERAILAAQLALDFSRNGVEAIVSLAIALADNGDLKRAGEEAKRAIQEHPEEPLAWSCYYAVCEGQDELLTPVPTNIASSERLRLVLAGNAARKCDWAKVIEITGRLLEDGFRGPDCLLNRSTALVNSANRPDVLEPTKTYQVEDAIRLTTEVINSYADQKHTNVLRALGVRAFGNLIIGNESASKKDRDHVRKVKADDLNALMCEVQALLKTGNRAKAYSLLDEVKDESSAFLLAFRAQVGADLGRIDSARSDMSAAIELASGESRNIDVLLLIAESALGIGEFETALRFLDKVESECSKDPRFFLIKGRLGFALADVEAGIKSFMRASELDSARYSEYLVDLTLNLMELGRRDEAKRFLKQLETQDIPTGARFMTAKVYLALGLLVPVVELINLIKAVPNYPKWVIALELEVALQSEDYSRMDDLVDKLVDGDGSPFGQRIEAARRLLEVGKTESTTRLLRVLKTDGTGSLVENMALAQLLSETGEHEEAWAIGVEAYRGNPDCADLHKGMISLAFSDPEGPGKLPEVGPNSCVMLEGEYDSHKEMRIYSEGPVSRLLGEYLVSDVSDIIGKKQGDSVLLGGSQWCIAEILPVGVCIARYSINKYQELFGQDPLVVKQIRLGGDSDIAALSGIIGTLESKREHADKVFVGYRNLTIPLGTIAGMLGGSIRDVMEHIVTNPELCGDLKTEYPDVESQRQSMALARSKRRVVLTRSALHTIHRLGLENIVSDLFTLIAPWSLRAELVRELAGAEKAVAEGIKTLQIVDGIPRIAEVDPKDPRLVSLHSELINLHEWFDSAVQAVPIPYEASIIQDSEVDHARTLIGVSSHGALALARFGDASLFCDDLGLRIIGHSVSVISSFSTATFLAAYAGSDGLDSSEVSRLLVRLVEMGYGDIMPTSDLISYAFGTAPELSESVRMKVIATLAVPWISPQFAASIAMRALRATALKEIQMFPIQGLAARVRVSMASYWDDAVVCAVIQRAAKTEFALLPNELDDVLRACTKM